MKKVLIVDDDESILDAVSLILEEYGYSVLTTDKGEETFDRIRSFKPDLILLDVLMSGSDGRIICKKLKQQPSTKKIPIVMISAHPSAKESSKKSGADDFIPKPFETSELLQKIEMYIH